MLTNAFSQLLFYRPRAKLTNYVISLVTVSFAVAAQWWLFGFEITYFGFLVWLYFAVLLSAVLGGLYSGLSSIAICVVFILTYSLITPADRVSATREIQTLVFIGTAFVTSYIIHAVKNTYQITISILNNLQSFTAILNSRGSIVDVNQATLKAFGFKRSALIGRSILGNFGLGYSQETRRKLKTAITEGRKGKISRFDFKATAPNGNTFYIDFTLAPIYDRQGNVISFAASGNDITARVLSEKKAAKLNKTLEQKLSELETLFTVLPIGIGISRDQETQLTAVNPALAKMLALSSTSTSSLMNSKASDTHFHFVKNGHKQKTQELPMNLALTKGQTTLEDEAQIVRDDGLSLNVLQYAMPILDEKAEIIGSIGAFVDITEFKKISAQLRESQSKFRALLNSNLIGVVVAELDEPSRILEANDAFCTMTGYTQEEIKDGVINWQDLTPPEFAAQDAIALKELEELGEAKPYEKVFFRDDGTRLPILIGAAMSDIQQNTCVAFILDITARKKLERRKDEFIGLASHELKTPLTSMKVFIQLLQRSFKASEDTTNLTYIERMNRQIDRLSSLVEELLDVSKIEAGQLQLKIETFNANDLVKDTIQEMEGVSSHHRLSIKGKASRGAQGDVFRLKQVLINLITNAVKYSPQAEKVTIKISQTSKETILSVTDQGVGIPELDQKRIFEKFFRASGKNKHSFPGLGLGLYLSKKIVERHGGRIWLESIEGQGSTFSFSLPTS